MFQFAGRAPLPGLRDILDVLAESLLPLTIASWLRTPQAGWEGATAEQLLREGAVGRVLAMALELAASTR